MNIKRCPWSGKDETIIHYHDNEWGVPLHDDKKLFKFLVLDAFQAGLSWQIVLKKRKGFEKAFSNFDPILISKYDEKDFNVLINNADIIRNKLKIQATITNAQKFLEIQEEFGSFDKYIWQFTNGKTIKNKWKSLKDLPSKTHLSDKMSENLKKRGFKFVGSTICYAFMQASGMVNDHLVDCFRYGKV